jgi:hypothetical protein
MGGPNGEERGTTRALGWAGYGPLREEKQAAARAREEGERD